VAGIWERWHRDAAVKQWTVTEAVPVVSYVTPQADGAASQLILPGDVEAWYEAPIYARVNGYLKKWYFDYGATVKAGQILAGYLGRHSANWRTGPQRRKGPIEKPISQTWVIPWRRWKARVTRSHCLGSGGGILDGRLKPPSTLAMQSKESTPVSHTCPGRTPQAPAKSARPDEPETLLI
jgi:hypothetical protein